MKDQKDFSKIITSECDYELSIKIGQIIINFKIDTDIQIYDSSGEQNNIPEV